MVRKVVLGESERRILSFYIKGERVKGYTSVLSRIRRIGLKQIIEGCEKDLELLRKLAHLEESDREAK
jgi:hypothetical protein